MRRYVSLTSACALNLERKIVNLKVSDPGMTLEATCYTQRNIFQILSNQTEIRLHVPCNDRFGTGKRTLYPFAVPNQSVHGKYNLIWVWFYKIWEIFLRVHQSDEVLEKWAQHTCWHAHSRMRVHTTTFCHCSFEAAVAEWLVLRTGTNSTWVQTPSP